MFGVSKENEMVAFAKPVTIATQPIVTLDDPKTSQDFDWGLIKPNAVNRVERVSRPRKGPMQKKAEIKKATPALKAWDD